MDFWAPDAKILVVDDNKMNLTLAKNLISSFGIRADCAGSGEAAISMLEDVCYHVVFMDYLMPGMDGVETTERIRQKEGAYYRQVPIIALTGEDMPDMEQFQRAGMNDYLSKPLEKSMLGQMLQKWLPEELLREPVVLQETQEIERQLPDLQGIDAKEGIRNSGGYDAFCSFLGDFYKLIDTKAHLLETCLTEGRLREYTIEVHSLKNSARIIGAIELSQYFQQLEYWAKSGNVKKIEEETPLLLVRYRGMKSVLEPYGVKETAGSKKVSVEDIISCLRGMQEAVEAFDIDSADMAMEQMEEFCLPEKCNILMDKLRVAVADVAMEDILVLIEEIIIVLGE